MLVEPPGFRRKQFVEFSLKVQHGAIMPQRGIIHKGPMGLKNTALLYIHVMHNCAKHIKNHT
jgi:hypothetical protein